MGVGGISESIGLFLTERNDLGVHSEIMTVGHIDPVSYTHLTLPTKA